MLALVLRRRAGRVTEVLLVCSTGGHLLQLRALEEVWRDRSRAWVTFDKSDARSLLRDEHVCFAYGPTNRSVANLARNLVLAWRLLGRLRPGAILTTGAGVAVPFAWIGFLRRIPVVYVESFTRIDQPSASCRLIAPFASSVYVQWPALTKALPRSVYAGSVFSLES